MQKGSHLTLWLFTLPLPQVCLFLLFGLPLVVVSSALLVLFRFTLTAPVEIVVLADVDEGVADALVRIKILGH